MKNKYLLSLLAALGFSGCSNNNIWDEPCYYGPGPSWQERDLTFISQIQNEDKESINGIRVVAKYRNQNDSLITDTAYTEPRKIDGLSVGGIATNQINYSEFHPKDGKITIECTDVDGEKNGEYQQKVIETEYSGQITKITLDKKAAEEEKDKK